MKIALFQFSSSTISWVRVILAIIIYQIFFKISAKSLLRLDRRAFTLSSIAGLAFGINYYCYIQGVNLSGPSNAQIIIQLAAVGLALTGLFVFREPLRFFQFLGILISVFGFYLFYLDQASAVADQAVYQSANVLLLIAALSWIVYGLVQKHLSAKWHPQQINTHIFIVASLCLLPFVIWSEFSNYFSWSFICVLLLGACTALAYGCLAEAMKRSPIAQVSMLVTLNPLITLFLVVVFEQLGITWLDRSLPSVWGYLGAFLSVAGVLLVVAKR